MVIRSVFLVQKREMLFNREKRVGTWNNQIIVYSRASHLILQTQVTQLKVNTTKKALPDIKVAIISFSNKKSSKWTKSINCVAGRLMQTDTSLENLNPHTFNDVQTRKLWSQKCRSWTPQQHHNAGCDFIGRNWKETGTFNDERKAKKTLFLEVIKNWRTTGDEHLD